MESPAPSAPVVREPASTTTRNSTFSPVTVTETVGAVFLGLTTLVLLILFVRSEARSRALLAQLAAR